MVKEYIEIEQGSEEWAELRKGKLTGSNATCIGANGQGLKTYAKKIVLELLGVVKDEYYGDDMKRGDELEHIARMCYELEMGVEVYEVGCITNSKHKQVLVSPDGLIGNDGGMEIKARNDEKHLSLILGETKEIPKNQIQMNLLISGRKWWDFVSYNPNFDKPLFVERIYPDLDYHKKLKEGFESGRELIGKYQKDYKNYKVK